MQQIIDINFLKENPKLIFSMLPKGAENEIVDFLHFLMFKYEISIELPEKKQTFKNFIENPIQIENFRKYTREELHER